jgi:lipid II:glycine glycyltransferase (peptidoglycan interpeptide bridge formation enzyme)
MQPLIATYAENMLRTRIEAADLVTEQNASWDAFVLSAPGGHHVQSSIWGRVKADEGWEVIRVAVADGDEVVAGAQIAMKSISRFGRLGYIDHGPLVTPGADEAFLQLIELMEEAIRRHRIRALLVQLPERREDSAVPLLASGYSPTPVRVSVGATVLVDLSPEPEEILAQMKAKTRRNIRRSLRSGLQVQVADDEGFDAFCEMLKATGLRQGFDPDLDAVSEMRRQLGDDFEVLLAVDDSEPVAGILTLRFGDRVLYKRGAWSGRKSETHPNERLHWEAMLRHRDRGARIYDFEGVERSVAAAFLAEGAVPPEASQSVWSFKIGFGGEVVLLPDHLIRNTNGLMRRAHDIVTPRLAHSAKFHQMLEAIRR